MNFKQLLFILFICTNFCFAQINIISIHASVGDTIDKTEKIKYVLFEEIKNEDYFFSIISTNNSDTLITYYKKNDTLKQKISGKEVFAITNNINRLNAFYNSNGEAGNPNFIKNPSSISSNDDNRTISKKNLQPDKYEKRQIKSEKGIKTTPKEWEKLDRANNQYQMIAPTLPKLPPPTINMPSQMPTHFPR